MKRLIALFLFAGTLGTGIAAAQNLPSPMPGRLVHDFANVIPDDVERSVETKLLAYERSVGIELAVATVPSMDGTNVDEYANRLFQKWGIGKSGKDNGVLFLIGFDAAGNGVRIEVGYGLEPDLTDGASGRILDTDVLPYLKEKDYGSAAERGVAAIIGHLGERPFEARVRERREEAQRADAERAADLANFQAVIFILLGAAGIAAVVIAVVSSVKRRKMRLALRAENETLAKTIARNIRELNVLRATAAEAIASIQDPSAKTVDYLDHLVVKGSAFDATGKDTVLPALGDLEAERELGSRLRATLGAHERMAAELRSAAQAPSVLGGKLAATQNCLATLAPARDLASKVSLATREAAEALAELRKEFPGAKTEVLAHRVAEAHTLSDTMTERVSRIEAALAKGPGHALDAEDMLGVLRQELASAEGLPEQVREARKAQADAAKAYGPTLGKIAVALLKATADAKHADVESSTKAVLASARTSAEKLDPRPETPDWTDQLELATGVLGAITAVLTKIGRDKTEADEERKRAARRRSESFRSTRSSSSSYRSGGGGFSFGGGRSGGGGASRGF